jgi:PRC-barrel domain
MLVESPTGEKLGKVDGFVLDSASARPYYVVVDAGGWFKSKHFLLPVGHARLTSDDDRDALVADLSRDRIERFPGFDKDEFQKMSPEALKRFNDDTCEACSVTVVTYSETDPYAAWDRPDYAYPDWWSAQPTLPSRMGDSAFKEIGDYEPARTGQPADTSFRDRERVVAADRSENAGRLATDREMREGGETSPHYGGRAQPGDVLGLETGGESTSIGDTAEDENERRRKAEKSTRR